MFTMSFFSDMTGHYCKATFLIKQNYKLINYFLCCVELIHLVFHMRLSCWKTSENLF